MFVGGIEEVNLKKLVIIYKEVMVRIILIFVFVLVVEDENWYYWINCV